jgi:hypothetical protein
VELQSTTYASSNSTWAAALAASRSPEAHGYCGVFQGQRLTVQLMLDREAENSRLGTAMRHASVQFAPGGTALHRHQCAY